MDRIISWAWKALSYFPHISSSTLWNLVEFDIYGKLFSRRIQPFEYHGLRINSHGGRRQIPKLRHFHHIGNIGDCQIRLSPFWTFPLYVECSSSVLHLFGWFLEGF